MHRVVISTNTKIPDKVLVCLEPTNRYEPKNLNKIVAQLPEFVNVLSVRSRGVL